MTTRNKALLMILDGWGIGDKKPNNAIFAADTPTMDTLMQKYPMSTLVTYGEDVGLPAGQMGNSEVGHLNIGAGRVVYQELLKINKSLQNNEYLDNSESMQRLIAYTQDTQKPLHLMGLVSDGGVHSHIDHLLRLITYLDAHLSVPIYIHAFTDGRDTDPHSGRDFIQRLLQHTEGTSAQLASITGRYYAMDRDRRWERVALAYDAMVGAMGERSSDPLETIQHRYDSDESDEFLKPIICTDSEGMPIAQLSEGDALFCFNFRTDRPREIVDALSQTEHPDQNMSPIPGLHMLTMTEYSKDFKNIDILYAQEDITHTLGEVVDQNGLWQIRIAETEKYPHVTFFFSGGREQEFELENRILLDSPRDVATYDLRPEMSAYKIKDAIIPELHRENASFVCLNFANTDMVGHTGIFEAAVRAAETVDECVGEIVPQALEHGYFVIIIADHGNSDYMINDDGTPNTAHTMNPVPCIFIHPESEAKLRDGRLADIAPTILHHMGLEIPTEMTGDILTEL